MTSMRFRADLHVHPDFDESTGYRHGDHPEQIAAGIVASQADVYAITEHNKVDPGRFFNVEEEVARRLDGTRREVTGLVGTEMSLQFDGFRYHVGFVHQGRFGRENFPAPLPRNADLHELEGYRRSHPGITILYHATWKDHQARHRRPEVTQALMGNPLIDAVEIVNGTMLFNGHPSDFAREAMEKFMRVRRMQSNVAPIGCSDAHRGRLVGSALTEFTAATHDGLFDEVRRGNTRAVPVHDDVRRKVRNLMGQVQGIGRYIKL